METTVDKRDWIMLYLSISLLVIQVLYTRAAIRVSYLEGQADVYASFTEKGVTP